jgi:hypothetical protein
MKKYNLLHIVLFLATIICIFNIVKTIPVFNLTIVINLVATFIFVALLFKDLKK